MLHVTRANGSNRYAKQMVSITLSPPPNPARSPVSSDGSRAPTPKRLRLCHKQPGPDPDATRALHQETQAVPLMPNRGGPLNVATAGELRASDWTPEEQASINAQPTNFRKREMLRLRHNRTAEERDKHLILPYAAGGYSNVYCANCDHETDTNFVYSYWIADGPSKAGEQAHCYCTRGIPRTERCKKTKCCDQ